MRRQPTRLRRREIEFMTNFFNKSLLLSAVAAFAATVVSCHKEEPAPGEPGSRRIEVRIAAPATRGGETTTRSAGEELPTNPTVEVGGNTAAEMPQTRLAFDEDGATMRWTKGDRIALWGYNSGSAAFENETFSLWYPREDPSQGLFTGKVNAMAAGTYDYYAACPTPQAAAGTKVSYTIPEVQDGRWHSDLDIMLARTTGAELREEILNDVTLRFAHKVHALKITIPEGRNLLGRPVSELRIEFGQPVAGRLTWDLTNPDAVPEKEQTATGITLAFDTPVDEGDTFWVYLAPADLTGGEVRFVATDGEEFSWPLSTWNFRDCAAGRITPVKLTVDELRPQHRYTVTVDPAHLGEPVTQIDSIAMPAGYEFPSLNLSNKTSNITANADGTFSIKTFADQAAVLSGGMEVGMGVGSENTEGVYGKRCALSSPTADGCTVMSPYLFFEDFSETTEFDQNGKDNGAHKGDTAWGDAAGLPGWSGNQFYIPGGTEAIIRHRAEKYGGMGTYRGRLDSRPIKELKAGSLKVEVKFDYRSETEESRCTPQLNYGYTTKQEALSAYHGVIIFGSASSEGGEKIEHECGSEGGVIGSWKTLSFTIDGCTNACRLSWDCSYASSSGTSYSKSQWAHIGNVRVTIVH